MPSEIYQIQEIPHSFYESTDSTPLRPYSQQQYQQQRPPSFQTQQNATHNRANTSQGVRNTHKNYYKPTKEQLIQEKEEKFKEECTFQPKIIENNLRNQFQQLTQEERLKRLATPKSQLYVQREKQKFKQEMQQIKDKCSFTPSINRASKSISQQESTSFENVEDRLTHEADLKFQQRERLKRQYEQQEISQYSFTPQINSKTMGNKGNRPPIYMRVDQMVREKQESVNRARVQQEERETLTFKPTISPFSQKIATSKFLNESGEKQDVVTRLIHNAQQKLEKQQQLSIISQEQSFTFKPEIIDIKITKNDSKDFYQRQMEFQEQKRQNKNSIALKTQENSCTFAPNIDHNSRCIAESLKKNEIEDKFQKLSKQDNQKIQEKKKKIENDYYEQFTFEPKINKISSYIGRQSSFDTLANNEIAHQNKQKIQQEQLIKQNQNCTFKPQTTQKGKNAESRYNDPIMILNNIEKDKKKNEEKIQELKKNMEYEEIKDCTFKPVVMDNIKTPTQPVIVRGLGRHLELKDQAKKKYDEQKQREEKIFLINTNYQRDVPYTVPQPFKLSQTNNEKKTRKQQMLKEDQMKECTFQPQTKKEYNKSNLLDFSISSSEY